MNHRPFLHFADWRLLGSAAYSQGERFGLSSTGQLRVLIHQAQTLFLPE
jgi:hypothetical protein